MKNTALLLTSAKDERTKDERISRIGRIIPRTKQCKVY